MGSLVNWKHGTSWESCQKLMKSTPPVDKIGVRLVQSKDPSLISPCHVLFHMSLTIFAIAALEMVSQSENIWAA